MDEEDSLPDFVENFDFELSNDQVVVSFDFELSNDQVDALYADESVQWFPMNSPAGKLGIEVNELGEVRSTNAEVFLMEGEDERMKMSKYNKALGGKLYTVYVYRAGKQKIYDFELGMEIFKTFHPEYSAYQLKLRYENRDNTDCSLVNLSVDSFILPQASKGRSVTDDRVVLEKGQDWMNMIGNGNNVIGKYQISSNGIPGSTSKQTTLITVSTAAIVSNRASCFASMVLLSTYGMF